MYGYMDVCSCCSKRTIFTLWCEVMYEHSQCLVVVLDISSSCLC
jgi:hypothetical protein